MNKIFASADEAVRDIPDGATLMSGARSAIAVRSVFRAAYRLV